MDRLIFGLLLATAALLGVSWFLAEQPIGHAIVHPRLPSMYAGGPTEQRAGAVLWVGWGFGVLQILLFGSLMAFGARRRGPRGGMIAPLACCVSLYLATFSAMLLVHAIAAGDAHVSLWRGLPPASAILVYGLWPLGGIFTLLFVLGFRRWVLSDTDLTRYRRLLAGRAPSDPGSARHSGVPSGGAQS